MSSLILEVENLTVTYGSFKALKGVSMQIKEGEIVALVGPNGAGKSTLLETIAGIKSPSSGGLKLSGKVITHTNPLKRRKLGIMLIPQEGNLFPGMSVRDNLQLGAFLAGAHTLPDLQNLVYSAFPKLRDRIAQLAGTMSGGEQRMLAIGMGILANPKILMIDELSLGLAPKVVGNILSILRDIRDKIGITIVLAEQSIKVLNVADEVYGLEAGEIIFSERAQNLSHDLIKNLYLGV